MQTAEYQMTVTKEQFEVTKTTVTAMSTGENLQCTSTNLGCTGARHTYSWTIPTTMDCPLQVIRGATMMQESGSALLVDLPAEVVVEVIDKSLSAYGSCPGDWYATSEPRIAVMFNASAAPGVNQVQPKEVDPFLSIAIGWMFQKYQKGILGTIEGRVTEQH